MIIAIINYDDDDDYNNNNDDHDTINHHIMHRLDNDNTHNI